jgi:predicted Rossmann-fold nucleotide-binding protein
LHDKPILLADIDGYWGPLRALLDHIVTKGFAGPGSRELVRVVPSIEALMAMLEVEQPSAHRVDAGML